MKTLTGYYNRFGYEICAGTSRVIFRTNCGCILPGQSLDPIRSVCETMGKSLADERQAKWAGCRQVDSLGDFVQENTA